MPYPRLSPAAKLSRSLAATFMLAGVTLSLAANAPAQTETTIYNFGTTAPNTPISGLVLDKSGNLYGVTPYGGSGSHGVVYKLTPVSGGWQQSVIYSFTGGTDGGYPFAPPISDAAGNLYGTTSVGGLLGSPSCSSVGCGVVYKLSPTSTGAWRESVLYAFKAAMTA